MCFGYIWGGNMTVVHCEVIMNAPYFTERPLFEINRTHMNVIYKQILFIVQSLICVNKKNHNLVMLQTNNIHFTMLFPLNLTITNTQAVGGSNEEPEVE